MQIGTLRRDGRTDAFFDGAAADQLMIKRCTACRHWLAPDAGDCLECGHDDLTWTAATGAATLVSWAVSHGRPAADGTQPEPAVLALVELAEGPWLYGRLDKVDSAAALREGLPLRVHFEHPDEGEAYIVFHPA